MLPLLPSYRRRYISSRVSPGIAIGDTVVDLEFNGFWTAPVSCDSTAPGWERRLPFFSFREECGHCMSRGAFTSTWYLLRCDGYVTRTLDDHRSGLIRRRVRRLTPPGQRFALSKLALRICRTEGFSSPSQSTTQIKRGPSGPLFIDWRRGRDSNPRYSFRPYNGLANRRLQPLGHLSGSGAQDSRSTPPESGEGSRLKALLR